MSQNSKTALKLAVSQCLLGDKVRYDGTDNLCAEIIEHTNQNVQLIPFCPEVSIGMGVPRLPIQLDLVNASVKARRVNAVDYDYTDALKNYAAKFIKEHDDIDAVINKKGSPSCGYKTTKLYQDNELIRSDASGIFINELIKLKPDLLIIDENDFTDATKRKEFLLRLKLKKP